MSLEKEISRGIMEAMKSRDAVRLAALRNVKKYIIEAKTSGAGIAELPDTDVVKIISKLAKQGADSAAIYTAQRRQDLADEETAQVAVLQEFLPRQLSPEELTEAVRAVIAEVGATSVKEMGKVMGVASKRLAGQADGNQWVPAECDVSIRPGWFYHPEEDDRVKTVEQLTDLYYRSVGHNATLLFNFPVDRDGLIHPIDSANAVNFHKNVQKQLAHNLLAGIRPKASDERGGQFSAKAATDESWDTYWATNDDVTAADIEFDFPKTEKVNRMMIQEYIPLGQRVKSFIVEYDKDGKWLPVKLNEETTTVGYKRLLRFETVSTDKLRIRFTDARACLCINNIEAYYAGETADTFTVEAKELKSYPFTLVGVPEEETKKCMDKDKNTTAFVEGDALVIDLGEERTITSFHYLPDQSEYNKGLISSYELSVGTEANAVNRIVAQGEFSNIKNNPILQSVYFTPVKARYLSLKPTKMVTEGETMGFAEIGIQ